MDHFAQQKSFQLDRFGFHYFHDSEKYSVADAQFWGQKLRSINANWLILKNPPGRAIPENFIRYLANQKINLIIDFQKRMKDFNDFSEIDTLLQVYGKWGIKYACLFSQPNLRVNWGDAEWGKNDIVKKHTDLFLEFSRICVDNHIKPIFSTLYPCGDYFDLAFLENSLKIIYEKADQTILNEIVLSAYGWHHQHDLDWGSGGQKRWSNSSFQKGSDDNQDHRGFRLFEWYSEISERIFNKKLPIIIFETGFSGSVKTDNSSQLSEWSQNLGSVIKLLSGENVFHNNGPDRLYAPIGPEVIACCFYILSSVQSKQAAQYRWFSPDGGAQQIAKQSLPLLIKKDTDKGYSKSNLHSDIECTYNRYILIDHLLQSRVPNILEELDPYIKKHRPFIGFSLLEGLKSAFLIVITENEETFLQKNKALLEGGNIIKIVPVSKLQEFINE